MRAGDLDRLITIEQPTETIDAYGAPIQSWTTLAANVPAQVSYDNGSEYFAAGQMNARIDAVFKIRYRSDLTTKMRISYGGETYDIKFLNEIGRREGYNIKAVVHQA